MKRIHWGILGLGKMARIFSQDLVKADACQLYAVGSRLQHKAKEFANDFGAKKAYATYEELIQDEKVDIIYIATPHVFHFELAMQCLRAKKHVLCEKPLCMNL